MADALKALHTVEGLENVLITEKSSIDSPAKTEIKECAPRTTYKTSTRQKPVKEEPRTTQISTRTRGGSRRAPAGKDEENTAPMDFITGKMESQLMEVPEDEKKVAMTSTQRKPVKEEHQTTQVLTRTRGRARKAPAGKDMENTAPMDFVTRKMESQLNEVAEDEKKGAMTPAATTAVSRRKKGATSVKEVYSTRRTTRLLEKKLMGLNLDDVDDDQIVEKDAQVVEEPKSNEEAVVIDKEQGINCKKTEESDEKRAALLEDDDMAVYSEEDSLKIELQHKSDAIDESVDDKNVDAELLDESSDDKNVDAEAFDENKGYLESGSTKMDSATDSPTDYFVLKSQEEYFIDVKELEADSFGHLEIDQEVEDQSKEVITTFVAKDKSENDEDSMNKNEPKPEKSMIMVVTDEVLCDDHDHQLENEESFALDEIASDSIKKDEMEPEKNITFETGSEENIEFATVCEEKSDQPIAVFESKIVDNFEADVGETDENIETKSSKTTEVSYVLSDINKENFVKEKAEKVKVATTDMSIRQLKKMLKQLQISDNNTDIKDDGNIAKEIGKPRPALQPLSDNHSDE